MKLSVLDKVYSFMQRHRHTAEPVLIDPEVKLDPKLLLQLADDLRTWLPALQRAYGGAAARLVVETWLSFLGSASLSLAGDTAQDWMFLDLEGRGGHRMHYPLTMAELGLDVDIVPEERPDGPKTV